MLKICVVFKTGQPIEDISAATRSSQAGSCEPSHSRTVRHSSKRCERSYSLLVAADCVVCTEFRAGVDVLEKNNLRSVAGDARNNLRAYLPKVSVKDSLYNSLSNMHASVLCEATSDLMHVPRESAHRGLVCFNVAVKSSIALRSTRTVEA